MTMTPVLAGSAESSDIEKPSTTALSVRICNVCTSSLFSKRDFLHEVHLHPPVVRAYATLISFQSVIREMLPRFQKLADVVQKQRLHTDREVVLEALKMKRKILEALAKVDAQAKRINSLEDGDQGGGGRRTATQERLQCAIAAAAANWGMTIGLRVKSLAAIIDSIASKQRPTAVAEVTKRPGLGRQLSSLSSSGSNLKTSTTTTSLLATNPSTPSLTSPFQLIEQTPIEEEENRLKTQLMVLEEQKFMLGGMLEEAIKHRRLDEVATLRGNMEEIEVEVGKLMVEVGKLGC
jgi:rabenosyn-5